MSAPALFKPEWLQQGAGQPLSELGLEPDQYRIFDVKRGGAEDQSEYGIDFGGHMYGRIDTHDDPRPAIEDYRLFGFWWARNEKVFIKMVLGSGPFAHQLALTSKPKDLPTQLVPYDCSHENIIAKHIEAGGDQVHINYSFSMKNGMLYAKNIRLGNILFSYANRKPKPNEYPIFIRFYGPLD